MAAALALGNRQVLHPDGALGVVGRGTAGGVLCVGCVFAWSKCSTSCSKPAAAAITPRRPPCPTGKITGFGRTPSLYT